MQKFFRIAIDGPVSAGKGTVSRLVAERLGFLYIDTGAMYRVTAFLAIKNSIPLDDEAAIIAQITKATLDMRNPLESEKDGRLITIILDGEDVSWAIRTEEISAGSSAVSKLAGVRKILVEKQQIIAKNKNVVMEGRDITYRVLPDADLKIFLTASQTVRAKRRSLQLQIRGEDISFEQVLEELIKRDTQDTERHADPLKIVEDAWVVDTSDMSILQVVDLIEQKVNVLRAS
ncbi:MAG: (d)CMP kinase [Microgenomates group bacterium]